MKKMNGYILGGVGIVAMIIAIFTANVSVATITHLANVINTIVTNVAGVVNTAIERLSENKK